MTRRTRWPAAWALGAWAAVTAVAAGCAWGGRAPVRSEPAEERAEVVYEVGGAAALPLSTGLAARTGESAVLPVGYREGAEGDGSTAVGGRPSGAGFGRLELFGSGGRVVARVSLYDRPPRTARVAPPVTREPAAAARRDGARPVGAAERVITRPVVVYELELPAAELALVLDELDATGAFSAPERPDGGTRLTVGQEAEKDWTPEPRLDDLAERVVREGREVPRRLPGGAGTARVRARGA